MKNYDTPLCLSTMPSVGTFGLRYRPYVVNIVLSNTYPGTERYVIQSIEKKLGAYNEHLNIQNNELLNCDSPGFLKSRYAVTLGKFDLTTIFLTPGFSQCQLLSSVPDTCGQQYILGGIPFPYKCIRLKHLIQDINSFLPYYPLDMGIDKSQEVPLDVKKRPILVVCQMHVAGFLDSLAASLYCLGLLKLIDTMINQAKDVLRVTDDAWSVSGILLDSQGWSNYTILLRGNNIEHLMQCVEEITSCRISDVYNVYDLLYKDVSSNLNKNSQESSIDNYASNHIEEISATQKYIADRYTSLIQAFLGEQDDDSLIKKSHKHFWASSSTSIAFLWPYTHDILLEECNRHNKELFTCNLSPDCSDWSVNGSVFSHSHLKVKPGHFKRVSQTISSYISDVLKLKVPLVFGSERHCATPGLYDLVVDGSLLSKHELLVDEMKLGENHKDSHVLVVSKLDELIPRIYYLRWLLLGCPHIKVNMSDGEEKVFPWFDREHDVPWSGMTDIIDSSTILQYPVNTFIYKYPETGPDFANMYLHYIKGNLGSKFLMNFENGSSSILRKYKVSRNLQNMLRQVLSLWGRELENTTNFSRMLELIAFFRAWRQSLELRLEQGNMTPREAEEIIRDFTVPFNNALIQRVLSGYEMSEVADIVGEYKGGLSQLLTNLDCIVQGVSSLMGDPKNIGVLTLIGQDSSAQIDIVRTHNPFSEDEPEIIYGIISLNFIHMAHPIKYATVLHEVLHLIIESNEFINILKQRGDIGLSTLMLLFAQEGNNSQRGLLGKRLLEMSIEYLVSWLVFPGEVDLYTQVFLMQVTLDSNSFSNDQEENKSVLIEHAARSFLVHLMHLIEPSEWKNCVVIDNLVGVWWELYGGFICNRHTKKGYYPENISKQVQLWVRETQLPVHLSVIKEAVEIYFGQDDYYDGDSNKRNIVFRKFVVSSLKEFHRSNSKINYRQIIEQNMEGNERGSTPVQVIFHRSNDKLHNSCLLRITRLESLISSLVLIRCFYHVLINLIKEDSSGMFIVERSEENGEVTSSSAIALDPQNGTLFTCGDISHQKYIRLRLSLFKSLYHIAETCKHTAIVDLVEKTY
nr:hypothetical protein 3 [Candidatus Hydrogenedentota bacterium]